MILVLKIFLWTLGVFGIIGTVASRLRFDDWWIRAFDFPRVQLTVLMLVSLCGLPFVFESTSPWYWGLLAALFLALGYQAIKIWPYTPMATIKVKRAAQPEGDHVISILESNVLMLNEKREPLLELIRKLQPDMVLLMETNKAWEDDMRPIEADYPHRIQIPQENMYGMHLYSRLELMDTEVRYLVKDDIPSIRTHVRLRNGERILLYAVHPSPPSPTEAYASTGRDGELLLVGKEAKERDEPTILTGDLNDVAWSHSTQLFRRVSQLLDPRRGRGFYSTFHADYLLARWPLDHFFHSDHFTLVELQRQPHIGSDHFPVLIKLAYEPANGNEQEEPDATQAEKKEAKKTTDAAQKGEQDTVESMIKNKAA